MSERILTISRAMSEAIAEEMRRDPSVFVMGEDVGKYGGIFAATGGLLDEFGPDRVRDTPISETAFIGAAVGAAMSGMRPVAELMFVDFFGVCMDAIYNLAAKNVYFSGGNCKVPMVLMTAVGGGYSDAGQHSQTLYATFAHMPGLKVAVPATAHDAKGLMITTGRCCTCSTRECRGWAGCRRSKGQRRRCPRKATRCRSARRRCAARARMRRSSPWA